MQDTNINNSLTELKRLLDAGVLTQEEFENGKARLLSLSEEKDKNDSTTVDVEEKQIQVVSPSNNPEVAESVPHKKKTFPLRFWYVYVLLLILFVVLLFKCVGHKIATTESVTLGSTIDTTGIILTIDSTEFIEDADNEEFVDNTFKESTGETKESHSSLWESGFLNDKFGEKDYSKPFIFLLLNKAYYRGEDINNGSGFIVIQVHRNAISFWAYDNHFAANVGDYINPIPVLFRTSQGDYEINTELHSVEAICVNNDDLQFIAQQLINGYFTIKVGDLLYKVTNECEGFLDACNTYLR